MPKQDKVNSKGEVAQAKMVAAALDLIAEGGLARASLAEIGRRAGYSRGLADYHFGSKAELVEQVVKEIAATWTAALAARGIPRMRGVEALATMFDVYFARLTEDPRRNQVLVVMSADAVSVTPEIRAGLARHDEAFRRLIRRWVREAKEDGAIRADVDPVNASVLIEGLLRGVCMQWLLAPSAFTPSEMTGYVLDAVIGGLGSPSGLVRALSQRDHELHTRASSRPEPVP